MKQESTDAGPRVSIIVVNFNGAGRVGPCLDSLHEVDAGATFEVLAVDNASTDGSDDEIVLAATRHPSIQLLRAGENLGYAGAVNLALPRCRGRYVAVLNMDLLVDEGWLGPLVECLEADERVGGAMPVVMRMDGRGVNAAGQDVHVTGLGFNRALGEPLERLGDAPFAVSGLMGAAFVVRRCILDEVGGLDALGFLYHEDVNLSWLLHLMGYELRCVPASTVRHDYFLSMYPQKLHLLERNRLAMLLAYLRPGTWVLLSPLLLLTELMNWAYAALRGPEFLAARGRCYGWLWSHRQAIGIRRGLARRLRRRGDLAVLARMRWGYAWRQFATLASERGPSARRIEGRPPRDA